MSSLQVTLLICLSIILDGLYYLLREIRRYRNRKLYGVWGSPRYSNESLSSPTVASPPSEDTPLGPPLGKLVKVSERKPIVIRKTTTMTIEIDKERYWKDHQLVEKLLPYINGGMEYIDEDDDGDTELTSNTNVKIEIKDEDKKMKLRRAFN